MKVPVIFFVLLPLSLLLGSIKFLSVAGAHGPNRWVKVIEFWNDFVNYFITALIGYYFVIVFWPSLSVGRSLSLGVADFVLFLAFLLGIFGHLCVFSYNVTESIAAIIKRVFR
jgi:hypothetical protein